MKAGGDKHAANRRQNGQESLPKIGQLADVYLPFDLEAHQQEEDGHQPVVDPVLNGIVQKDGTCGKIEMGMPEMGPALTPTRVSDQHRYDRAEDQDQSPCLFAFKKFLKELAKVMVPHDKVSFPHA